jgi:nucleoid DNA-binding protein
MSNVTKKDLVASISDNTGITQVDTGIVLESFLEAIYSSLKLGKNIELRGFGRFKLRHMNAREGRNPRTGEAVHVDEKIKPTFHASRELMARVNIVKTKTEIITVGEKL